MTVQDISIAALSKAIIAFSEGMEVYSQSLATEARINDDTSEPYLSKVGLLMRDGLIQRFEFTFDLARKLTKRTLLEIFQRDEYDYRNDIWREAARYRLIANAEDWIKYHDQRNLTSHSYDELISDEVFTDLENFLRDVRDCLQRIVHETRKPK